jgi:uncharacterized membrane protein YeaQ/YmgE (transglycosylase-associated protein family)
MQHGIIAWLVIGAVAGWLAGKIVEGSGFGLIIDIVVGIVGAVIGGYVTVHRIGAVHSSYIPMNSAGASGVMSAARSKRSRPGWHLPAGGLIRSWSGRSS